MKKVCVIGYPAKHSLSPKIHGYWLEKYGIEGTYEIREIEPDKFDDFFLNLEAEGYVGCNITIPYKERAYKLIQENSNKYRFDTIVTEYLGAVNTIYKQKHNNIPYIGMNTDYYGFVDSIKNGKEDFDFSREKTVILGAGGASMAVTRAIFDELCQEIVIINRSIEKAKKLKDKIEETHNVDKGIIKIIPWESRHEALKNANLLVNTTSLGMTGQPPLDIDLSYLPKDVLVTDIVYRPLITPLLQAAKDRGNPIVDGLGMLLYQAVPGFEMWFKEELNGRRVEVTEELRNVVIEAGNLY